MRVPAIALMLGSVLLALYGTAVLADAQSNDQKKHAMIADALMAGPPSVTERARVVDLEGNVLGEGSNDWTCQPGPNLNGKTSECNDAVWVKFNQALAARADFRTDRVGFSYMLAGDEGTSNIDPDATKPTPDNDWIAEGPHVMILFPDPALLEGISTDPHNGGPYVMFPGTPYAHVMWPLGPR